VVFSVSLLYLTFTGRSVGLSVKRMMIGWLMHRPYLNNR